MRYWLVKSEPEVFSFDDLLKSPERQTFWDGVRNYQARTYLRDAMHVGDPVLFYHSNAKPPAIVGLTEVCKAGAVDPTQFDPRSSHYDAASTPDKPRWYGVTLRAKGRLKTPLSLPFLREVGGLEGLGLLKRGSRLSVQHVSAVHFKKLCALGKLAML